MKWRKFNRILHRDIGYFFFGMCIIYGLSGIALNHIDDWDPSYIINNERVTVDPSRIQGKLSRDELKQLLNDLNINNNLKQQYSPGGNIFKIFVKNGSVTLNKITGEGIFEEIKRRPVFYEVNYLHYNNPKFLWTGFSDIYGAGLVIMAITGLFMLQGRRGLSGRGKWYVGAGILIPLIFLILYLN
ncbi:PepSY-associated TM helix domain-containing protein [Bacteroidota bacterium]